MEKSGQRWLPRLLLLAAMSVTPWLLIVYCHRSVFNAPPVGSPHPPSQLHFHSLQEAQLKKLPTATSSRALSAAAGGGDTHRRSNVVVDANASDPCRGRYLYIHDLPPRFNADILANCRHWYQWIDMCQYLANAGLGAPLDNADGAFADRGWYATDHFGLDVIFHSRVRQYACLTNDSARAAAVFVPYYAGFDVVQHLWSNNATAKDGTPLALADWLTRRPEWRAMGGRDHFVMSGRTAWDHQRQTDSDSEWGNKLLRLPAVQNMTVLFVEKAPWTDFDFAVPYPTYFHPAKDADILQWQQRMRGMKRDWLFAFAGGERPGDPTSIRHNLIRECNASSSCNLVQCRKGEKRCLVPSTFMRVFQTARFCLQPPGDTYTRRSVFDAILAGCVPVFFHLDSAYRQYRWHLPDDHASYSVFISEEDIRSGNASSVEETLRRIPQKVAEQMTETVIGLIPRLVYADPRSKLETLKDAVDFTVEAVIKRVNKLRKEMGDHGASPARGDVLIQTAAKASRKVRSDN
ncbi:xyloglucan galactosyltransferase KATAMARI1 homolog [Lolium rigidum]|uniref:xyloglucan galactosyltransferase KATAMARI1 homolog n=1 Tax=Lolium rigidum TaxID=89674 RepID=UPI001F5D1F43|nr:xyloglucan galactosyltransferase KATAMARI1 homolog [Lolium rigidum]